VGIGVSAGNAQGRLAGVTKALSNEQRSIAYLKREIRTQAMAKPVQRIGRRDVS
jgi:hypothetical protein